jgi:hypothetical protein
VPVVAAGWGKEMNECERSRVVGIAQKSKYSVGRNSRVGVTNAIQGDEKSTTNLGIGKGREVVLNSEIRWECGLIRILVLVVVVIVLSERETGLLG